MCYREDCVQPWIPRKRHLAPQLGALGGDCAAPRLAHLQHLDEDEAVLAGAQLPFGGHKGSAIALMVELLASGLTGAPLSSQQREEDVDSRDASPTRAGELVLAINPGVTSAVGGAGAVAAHCESLFAEILGDEGARLPSSRRYQVRETTPVTGVEVPGWLHDAIIERRGPP